MKQKKPTAPFMKRAEEVPSKEQERLRSDAKGNWWKERISNEERDARRGQEGRDIEGIANRKRV